MKLPKQAAAVERQASIQPIDAGIDPAFLQQLVGGLFDLGALVCEAFSGREREECLRGYNMVAKPAKDILSPLTSLI
jgi:hypothetical protein